MPIPKEIFIEEKEPDEIIIEKPRKNKINPLEKVFEFLQTDFEEMGYRDAINEAEAEDGIRNQRLNALRQDLRILIEHSILKIEEALSDIDTKITRATRNGLIDTVDNLRNERAKLSNELEKLKEMKTDILKKNESSDWMRIISEKYDLGFRRGVAEKFKTDSLLK
ncbi:MAG: hypothetical protein N2Z23_09860 [Pyrinomonadaceae bacterium]|nr:hypothetical protein [Pyrinomonadaceae bacterium]MDW8305305.1 hypothetical protein [Acidobacteriota bacterium]